MYDPPPEDGGPSRRGRRPPPPDPRIQLTFLFLTSLLVAQLASSLMTSRNLFRLFESEVREPNRRLENRIRKEDARSGTASEDGSGSGDPGTGRGSSRH